MDPKYISLENLQYFYNIIKNKSTINTTNDSNNVILYPNNTVIFNTAQTFNTKTFTINIDDINNNIEYIWSTRFLLNSSSPTINFSLPSGYTLKWANSETPEFTGGGKAYEITFKYIPGVNIIMGVYGEF